MTAKVTHNFRLKDCLKDRKPLFDRIGQYMIRRITDRTDSQHVDADGKAFKPYTPEYQKYREKKGRSAAVNLTYTGRMMSNIRGGKVISQSDSHVEIGVSGAEIKKAAYVQEAGREFLGINRDDERGIDQIVDEWIAEELDTKL